MAERTTFPEIKTQRLEELDELIKQSHSIFLADFTGINVEKMNLLRDRFHEKGITFRVVKNTLGKIALNNNGIDQLDDYLQGQNAFAFGFDDPAIPAKVIINFAKENDLPKIKSCIFEGEFYGSDKMELIKDLPTRDELLAQLVGQVQAPLANFVFVLNEIIRSFLGVIEAVIQKKTAEQG